MSQQDKHFYEFGEFRLDLAKRRLLRAGEIVPLAPKVFDVLWALAEQSGRTVEKDELMARVWPDTVVEENNLTQNIYTLRKIFGERRGESRYIATVPGIGYRFVAEVKQVSFPDEEITIRERTQALVTVTETGADEVAPAVLPVAPATPLLPAAAPARPAPRWLWGGLLALVAMLAAALVWQSRRANSAANGARPLQVSQLTLNGTTPRGVISPDGKQVIHVVKEGDRESLWLRHLATSSTQQIVPPEAASYTTLNFSHDGNYLFFVKRKQGESENVLYKMPALGGIPTRLAAGMEAFIGVSPDDRRLAYVRHTASESALLVANADGSEERRLAVRPITDYFKVPAWSPDGKLIACSTGSGDGYERQNTVVGVSLADGRQTPLTPKRWPWTRWVEWLSDGSGLLITALEDTSPAHQIWHISYPQGEVRQLTNDSKSYFSLSLTADAKTLVASQTQLLSELWVAPFSESGQARKITFGSGTYVDVGWDAAGRIVYASLESGNSDIWRVNADGTGKQRLTTESATDTQPVVSPDGRYIVFASNRGGNVFHIWRMQSDGSNPAPLTTGGGERFPQISPDGQWVVYNSFARDENHYTSWKIPLAGGTPVRIAEQAEKAAVSPDGRHIAYYASETRDVPERRINIYPFASGPVAGGPPERTLNLPPQAFPQREVRWAADGRAVYFSAEYAGFSDLWRLPLDGGPARPFTNFKMEGRLLFDLSPDGKQVVLARRLWTFDLALLTNFR